MKKSLIVASCLPLMTGVALAKGGGSHSTGRSSQWNGLYGSIQQAVNQYHSDQGGCRNATRQYDDQMFSGGQKDQGQLNSLRNNKDGACSGGANDQRGIQSACSAAQSYLDSHRGDANHQADQNAKNGLCNGYNSGNGGHTWGNNTHGSSTHHGTGNAGNGGHNYANAGSASGGRGAHSAGNHPRHGH